MPKNIKEIIQYEINKALGQPITTSNMAEIQLKINSQISQIIPSVKVQITQDKYNPANYNILIDGYSLKKFKYLSVKNAKTHTWSLISDEEMICLNCNMISSTYTVVISDDNNMFVSDFGDLTCKEIFIKNIIE